MRSDPLLTTAEADSTATPALHAVVREGALAAWPICVGYLPIGLAFGVMAQKAGFSLAEIGLMSLVVFAGSAQFIAVSMLSGGAAVTAIVGTTFIVNLRHLLMSSSLALHCTRCRKRFLSLFAHGVTDESFGVNMVRFRQGDWTPSRALTVNVVSCSVWLLSTVLGGWGGQFIPAGSFGMDYALIAMFLCLLALQLRGAIYWITAVMAGVVAVAVSLWMPGNGYVMIASLVAPTLGLGLKRMLRRRARKVSHESS